LAISEIFRPSVIINHHFKIKHGESVDDEIILSLVQMLDGKTFETEAEKEYIFGLM